MRRSTFLLVLCSALFIRLPAGAQATVEHNLSLTFRSTGNSVWGPRSDSFNYDLDLTTGWDKTTSGGGSYDLNWWIIHLGTFGGEATASTKGTVGLRLNAHASGGTVNVIYPVTVKLKYPKQIPAGQQFTVDTSFVVDPSANVSTAPPSVGATLRAVMDMDFRVHASAQAFSASIFDTGNLGFGIHPKATDKVAAGEILLFDLAQYLTPDQTSKTITIPPNSNNPVLTAQLNLPLISTSGGPGSVPGDANSTATTGSALIASLTGNLTNLVTTALPELPPLNYTFSGGGFAGGYHVLNAEAQLSMALQQDFRFVPTLYITLVATDNVTGHAAQVFRNVRVGDSVKFTMPNNGSAELNTLNIVPTVTMTGGFTNDTNLLFTGSLSFTPLDVFASGSVSGYTICDFDFQPFGPFTYVNSAPLPLYNTSFALPGFAAKAAPSFTVLQKDLVVPRMEKLTPVNPSNQSPVGMPAIDPPATGSNSTVVDFIVESDGHSWPQDDINDGPDFTRVNFTVDEVQGLSAPVDPSGISNYGNSGGHINNVLRVGIPVGSEASSGSGYALSPGIHHLTCHVTSGPHYEFHLSTVRDFYVLYPQPRTDHIESLGPGAIIGAPAQTDASLFAKFGNGPPLLTFVAPTSNESGNSAIGSFGAFTKVLWNGKARQIQDFSNDGQRVTFILLPGDLKDGGSNTIQAVNPTPGGGKSPLFVFTISNPVPSVTEVHVLADSLPAVVTAGIGSFKLTFKGRNFVPSSMVQWNGNARPTEYVSDTLIRCTIFADDIASGGSASVRVVNPNIPNPSNKAISGGTSNAVNVQVNNPVPHVASLTPAAANLFSGGQTLTVNGSGFVAGVAATYNGQSRAVVLISPTQLQVSLLDVDLASLHSATFPTFIVVTNAAPAGGASNAAPFQVVYGSPAISGISPNQTVQRGPAFTLTVTGGPFYVGSKVLWNGTERSTIVVSSTKLTATISTADLDSFAPVNVTVSNPTSTFLNPAHDTDGGPSNSVVFTVAQAPAVDVSGQIMVKPGVFTYNRARGTYDQRVTLTNVGGTVSGPISLILSNLGTTVLSNKSGITSKVVPAGRPYMAVTGGAFAGGSSVTITLNFKKGSAAGITYTTQVVANGLL